MRVLHLDSGRQMRGGQWQVLRLVEGLARSGTTATLLARADSPLFLNARACNLDVRSLSIPLALTLARQADIVHTHDARSHTLAAFLFGPPVVVARRVAFPIHSGWKYRRAARFLAVSKFVRGLLVGAGIPERRISVVYDGVPLLESPSNPNRILAPKYASGEAKKGTDLTLQAAGLAGLRVHFSTNLEADLATAAMLVYITRSEGLGSGALLAMSAGVPVIASNTGGLPEVIDHERDGLLTENAPRAIAEAMRRLNGDARLAHEMGIRAREKVAAQFSVDLMVRNTMRVYEEVLSS